MFYIETANGERHTSEISEKEIINEMINGVINAAIKENFAVMMINDHENGQLTEWRRVNGEQRRKIRHYRD